MTRLSVLVALATLAGAIPVRAQSVQYLSHSSFHLAAERLATDDDRFKWDTNFGGDVDLVDYGHGRLNFLANYEAVLGNRFRAFDPEQGNYILEGSTSWRVGGVEVAGVFYHQSRHLSDRSKRFAVDWNMLGGRVQKQLSRGASLVDAHVDARRAVYKSYVDYTWEVDGAVREQYALTPAVAIVAEGGVRMLGVNGTQSRGTQGGAHGEGGIRFQGRGAAVELYVAAERRIDPYPLEFGTMSWVGAGFRLLSR